jgi:hypothetical protein
MKLMSLSVPNGTTQSRESMIFELIRLNVVCLSQENAGPY